MNHADIERLAHSWVVDAADRPANPRVQQVVLRLLGDLCKAIEDLDITPTEFWSGVAYMSAAGAANELGLLAAGLGLERFLDIRADEAEEKAGLAGGTPRTIEGPLYVAGAPESVGFARLDDGLDADRGEVLFMQGTVFDQQGKPLPGAKVEVWHANLLGNYSFFDRTQSHFNLRRTIVTDEHGRYQFRSIIPVGYGCPPDGTTQALLNQLGRHGQRPAHIHFFISAPGHRHLTTQINLAGDQYLWDDFAYATRDGLIGEVRFIDDAAAAQARGVEGRFAEIEFDFQLQQAVSADAEDRSNRPRALQQA